MAEITLKIHINNISLFSIGEIVTINNNIKATVVELKALPTEL